MDNELLDLTQENQFSPSLQQFIEQKRLILLKTFQMKLLFRL